MSLRRTLLALSLLCAPLTVRGQEVACDDGDVEVVGLTFTGNKAFTDAELADGLITTSSTWLRRTVRVAGTRRCMDRAQFPVDVVRLLIWYRNHGYVAATVDTAVTPAGEGKVRVRFHLSEGEPVRVDSLRVTGLEAVPERERLLRGLPLEQGAPFDKYAMAASRDTLVRRLRDGGYPDADLYLSYETRTSARRATVTYAVVPGARARLGAVDVVLLPHRAAERPTSSPGTILAIAGLQPGALYRQRDLERAKRVLYSIPAFAQVAVEPEGVGAARAVDSLVGVRLRVTEGAGRQARLGGGWGTLDCFRVTGELTNHNVLGTGTRLDLQARTSKIGIGAPLGGAESLCPQARNDIFSRELNYYVGATMLSRPLARGLVQPSLTVFSEKRSEFNAYLRETPIGLSVQGAFTPRRTTYSLSYALEYGSTEAFPALFCAIFNACNDAEQAALQRRQRLAVAGLALARDRVDNPVNPSRGWTWRADVRHSAPMLLSDRTAQFTRGTLDGSAYVPLGSSLVLAGRLRMGVVLGPTFDLGGVPNYIPPQERLYAGGPTTVRGYRQNELGPAVYIPTGYDTVRADGSLGGNPANLADTVFFRSDPRRVAQRAVPTGGNTLLVANLEARWRSPILPRYLQWTAFVDAGEVWNRGSDEGLTFRSLFWTPGVGVRVASIIGFIRVDVGYNPYQRPAGTAYFDQPLAQGGQLLCTSPSNRLRVVSLELPNPLGPVQNVIVQQRGDCPVDFRPPRPATLLRRLAFNFSIGQAF